MNPAVLHFDRLSKSYGSKHALKNVSIEIQAGEKIALLGCNGAGKSTLLSIATGLRLPSAGHAKIFGQNPTANITQTKLAYLPQTLKFPSYLKVKEILNIVEAHFKTALNPALLERLELSSLKDRYCSGLSGGEERKLGLALALVGHRPFLILDEPTANVDLVAKHEIHKLLQEHVLEQNQAFLFSSHEMDEVEKLADRVIVLNHGQVVADDKVQNIKKTFGSMTVEFESETREINLKTTTKIEISDPKASDSLTSFSVKAFGLNSDSIIQELVESKINFRNLKVEQTSLDEVFLKIWSGK